MRDASPMRALARTLVPQRYRRFLQRVANEAPQRLRDLPADLASLALPRAFGGPLPPPSLRARVGQSSRRVFAQVGRDGSRQILDAFERTRRPGRPYPAWLDFGCGCGRLARYVGQSPSVDQLHGVDVDPALVAWAQRELPGQFAAMRPQPPLPFEAASFDVVYAISIFTHYTEEEQFRWLDEIRRILKPEGLLIATTISPWKAGDFPGLSEADFARLTARGFLCVNSDGGFNERTAFHAPEYLTAQWSRWLTPRLYEACGFVQYQDLWVWERPRSVG